MSAGTFLIYVGIACMGFCVGFIVGALLRVGE